jgi:hypothetical protein
MRMIELARCTYEFAAQTTFRNVVQIGAVIQDPGIAFDRVLRHAYNLLL